MRLTGENSQGPLRYGESRYSGSTVFKKEFICFKEYVLNCFTFVCFENLLFKMSVYNISLSEVQSFYFLFLL